MAQQNQRIVDPVQRSREFGTLSKQIKHRAREFAEKSRGDIAVGVVSETGKLHQIGIPSVDAVMLRFGYEKTGSALTKLTREHGKLVQGLAALNFEERLQLQNRALAAITHLNAYEEPDIEG